MRVPIWRGEVEGVASSEGCSSLFVVKPTAQSIGRAICEDIIEAKASDGMDQEDRELLVDRVRNFYLNLAVVEQAETLEAGRRCTADVQAAGGSLGAIKIEQLSAFSQSDAGRTPNVGS